MLYESAISHFGFAMTTIHKIDTIYFPPKQFSSRFGNNIFSCEVDSFATCNDIHACFVPTYISFSVRVRRGKELWTVRHRFREFDHFYQHCFAAYSNLDHKIVFPALPPKTCRNMSLDSEFQERRKEQLGVFLHELLSILSRLKVIGDPVIMNFFDLSESHEESA